MIPERGETSRWALWGPSLVVPWESPVREGRGAQAEPRMRSSSLQVRVQKERVWYREDTLHLYRASPQAFRWVLISTCWEETTWVWGKNHLKRTKVIVSDAYIQSKIVSISASPTGNLKTHRSSSRPHSKFSPLSWEPLTWEWTLLRSCGTNIKTKTWNNQMVSKQLNFILEWSSIMFREKQKYLSLDMLKLTMSSIK